MEVSTEKAVLNEGITFCEQLIEKFYWPVSLTVHSPTLCLTCSFYLQELTLSMNLNLSSSVIVAVLCNAGCSVAGFAVVLHYS